MSMDDNKKYGTFCDATTGETVTRELNDAEYAQHATILAQAKQDEADKVTAQEAKEAARTSAITKFKALGLTDDEIQHLIPSV